MAKSMKGRILIEHGKHAQRYFDASSDEKLHKAALLLLKERMHPKYGYIVEPDCYLSGCDKEYAAMTDEEVKALPESLRELATRGRLRAKESLEETKKEQAAYAKAKCALKDKDGAAAWKILKSRIEYEYEDVTLEWLENA